MTIIIAYFLKGDFMKKTYIFLLLSLLVFGLTSCATTSKIGFKLAENPTTGYVWSWEQNGSGSVLLVSDNYKQDKANKLMVGVGGEHEFIYQAVTDGEVILTFTLKRAWESTYSKREIHKVVIKDGKFQELVK